MRRANNQIQGVASYFLHHHRGGGGGGGVVAGNRLVVPTTIIHEGGGGGSSSFHSSSTPIPIPVPVPVPVLGSSSTSSSSSSRRWWLSSSSMQMLLVRRSQSAAFSSSKEPNPNPNLNLLLPKDVVLYQYEACPFCNKIKAFLDYNKIPYKVVEVNPISKKEIKWSDYKKVPILMVDGQQMVDSSEIIDMLARRLHPEDKPIHDSVAADADTEENKWRRWVDNHLVHILSPNIYRNPKEALESFDYITSHGNFSFTERLTVKYAGAAAMYFVSKKLKKRHNITDERAALYEAAESWVKALDGREFLGGSKPNLGDLAVFGVLRPIRNLSSGRDMVKHTHISEWYTRMEKAVGESSRVNS